MRRNGTSQAGGFTLIELLVVVGIIVLLIGILLAALSGSQIAAQKAKTQALLTGIASGCSVYYQDFGAYPGPFTEAQVCSTPTFTGAQNMYLGMARRWGAPGSVFMPSLGTLPLSLTGAAPIVVDLNQNVGPQDNSANPAAQKNQYFDPGKNVYPKPGQSYMSFTFPLVFDCFRDPLPILYYRKTPGVDNVGGTNTQLVVSAGAPGPGAAVAPFYLQSNQALTNAPGLQSANGVTYPQALTQNGLELMVANVVGSNTHVPIGGFVLISAGGDRIYGPTVQDATTKRWRPATGPEANPNNQSTLRKLDDVVVQGGQ